MVPLVIERRPELKRRERVLRITRIVPVSSTSVAIAHRTGQGVVGDQVRLVESTLAIADVHAIVARTPDRLLVANALQYRNACRLERGVERPEEAAGEPGSVESGDVVGSYGDVGINVDCLIFVQAEDVDVFRLNHRLVVDRPAIAAVELLGYRGAIVRVHEAANGVGKQLR